MTRGSVVHGEAYHNGRVLFGQGIIEAHRLETEVAKYPRILVSEEVRRAVWGYHEGRWEGRLLERDIDGCWFVNLLIPTQSSWAVLSQPETAHDVDEYLNKVRKSLIEEWGRRSQMLVTCQKYGG